MSTTLMPIKFTHASKALPTKVTFERSIGLVQTSVVSKPAGIRKLLATRPTSVMLCACMCAVHMLLHIMKAREFLATDWASILASMHTTMIRKLPTPEEVFAADLAMIRLFARMKTTVLD